MIILLDNGSKRAESVLNLRRLGEEVQRQLGKPVEAISLQHVDGIDPELLDGRPALSLKPFLRQHLQARANSHPKESEPLQLRIVPLFFGPSRAIDSMLTQVLADIEGEFGPLDTRVAQPLCPLPAGEPRLVDILEANVRAELDVASAQPEPSQPESTQPGEPLRDEDSLRNQEALRYEVLVVDHGSPVPQVTAVREWLTGQLAERLSDIPVGQAVMERRSGAQYDFNGDLLEDCLTRIAEKPAADALVAHAPAVDSRTKEGSATAVHEPMSGTPTRVVLAMQFISPGRHAGAGGDIAEIAQAACDRYRHLEVRPSPLIGTHPLFTDILIDRIRSISQD